MDKEILVKILIKAQNGDRAALDNFCKISELLIRNYFIHKFRDNEIVNDLCQETYTRLVKSFTNIREPQKYKHFVLKTAFYVLQDFLRNKAKENQKIICFESMDEVRVNEEGIYKSIDEQVLSNIDLKNALEKLPQKSQNIIKMHVQGYKYHEIAEKMRLSESAIKMQVKRSLQKLNDLLSM